MTIVVQVNTTLFHGVAGGVRDYGRRNDPPLCARGRSGAEERRWVARGQLLVFFVFLTQLGFWLEFSDIRLWPYINERRLHVIPSYGSDWRVLQYMLRKSQTPGISICFRKCFSEVTCLRRTKTATRCCWCKIKAWESQVKFGRSEICNTEPITYDFKGQKV